MCVLTSKVIRWFAEGRSLTDLVCAARHDITGDVSAGNRTRLRLAGPSSDSSPLGRGLSICLMSNVHFLSSAGLWDIMVHYTFKIATYLGTGNIIHVHVLAIYVICYGLKKFSQHIRFRVQSASKCRYGVYY